MHTFWHWLIEASQPFVDPSVLKGYELEFRRQLERLIQRTENPALHQKFLDMLDCPITDSTGRCRDFSEYVLSALIKSGVHHRYDVEDALNYVMTQMLMDRSIKSGQARQTLFGGFEDRTHQPGENPLQARFMTFLTHAVRNITSGRIAPLADTKRPAGSVSIGSGRSKHDQGFVSPDEIGGKTETNEQELMADILALFQRKEKESPGLPLVDLFKSMIAGETSREQRAKFGYRNTDEGRKLVKQVIQDYATATDNIRLLSLLGHLAGEDRQTKKTRPRTPSKPKLDPQDQDFASIVSVIERKGGSVTHAVLGSLRRRWLERAPRDSCEREIWLPVNAADLPASKNTEKPHFFASLVSHNGSFGMKSRKIALFIFLAWRIGRITRPNTPSFPSSNSTKRWLGPKKTSPRSAAPPCRFFPIGRVKTCWALH